MLKEKLNLALVVIVTLGLSACASKEQKMEDNLTGISGAYEAEISYSDDLPSAERWKIFGIDPDIEFNLVQKGDKLSGEFSGDRDGEIIKGKIDDKEVTFDFVLEARGGELKEGDGTWIIQEDGSLKGDFNVRDRQLGIVRGRWTLTRI